MLSRLSCHKGLGGKGELCKALPLSPTSNKRRKVQKLADNSLQEKLSSSGILLVQSSPVSLFSMMSRGQNTLVFPQNTTAGERPCHTLSPASRHHGQNASDQHLSSLKHQFPETVLAYNSQLNQRPSERYSRCRKNTDWCSLTLHCMLNLFPFGSAH